MLRLLTPNKLTALRVLMGGAAVFSYGSAHSNTVAIGIAALALTIVAFALDGLDGYLARRLNLATPLGAQLDVLGDRISENIFFTYFAVCGEISLWIPVIFFMRGAITDFLRGLAATRASVAGEGEASFRKAWMLNGRWSRRLVASRASRVVYASLKCLCFCALGVEWMFRHNQFNPGSITVDQVRIAANFIVASTVLFCLLRAAPVFWEGRRDFLALARPVATQTAPAQPKILLETSRAVAAAR